MFKPILALAGVLFQFYPQVGLSKTLNIGNAAEPREIDPALANGVPESQIIINLFEGLVSLDPVNLDVKPGMAESWKITNDGKTYTFKLRKNLKWSDGTPITSADFVYSWRRVVNPKTASENSYMLGFIKNGNEIATGKLKNIEALGVNAPTPDTLVVDLVGPTPFFLALTAHQSHFPTPKKAIEKFGNQWTRPENIITSGPYKLAEWKINKLIRIVPREHYWDNKKLEITEAVFHPIEDLNTEEKAFQSGQIQLTDKVPTTKIPGFRKQKEGDPNHPFRIDPYLGSYFFRFNTTRKPLNDARVRRALSLVIDRKLITEKVTLGGETPAPSLVPPETAGYTYDGPSFPASPTEADIAEAKKLLSDAGYPNGQGFPKLEILYNTLESHKKLCLAIQQIWKDKLGISVGLLNQEWKVFQSKLTALDYDIARAGWIADYNDPEGFLGIFQTGGGNNQTGWSNKDYDRLLGEANQTVDKAKRFEILKNAEKTLNAEAPIMPIYYYTRPRLVSPKLQIVKETGEKIPWRSNIQGQLYLKHVALAD